MDFTKKVYSTTFCTISSCENEWVFTFVTWQLHSIKNTTQANITLVRKIVPLLQVFWIHKDISHFFPPPRHIFCSYMMRTGNDITNHEMKLIRKLYCFSHAFYSKCIPILRYEKLHYGEHVCSKFSMLNHSKCLETHFNIISLPWLYLLKSIQVIPCILLCIRFFFFAR